MVLVHLHAKITARIPQIDEHGSEVMQRFETTPGRVRLGALLPVNNKAPFELVNALLRKKDVQKVIDTVYRYCGQKEIGYFLRSNYDDGLQRSVQSRYLIRQG